MRKNLWLTICLILCLLVTVCSAGALVACNSVYTNKPNRTQSQKATSYVCVDVNPSVELVLDQNDVVMSANGANKDGKVLIFEEDGIVGVSLDVAIGNVATLALKYGYVQDGANVSVDVASSKKNDGIFEKVRDKFVSALQAQDSDITVSFLRSCDFVLEEELQNLKAQHPDNQQIQNLDIANYRLLKKAEQSGISMDEALGLSFDNLISTANDVQSDISQKFDDTYQTAVFRAQYLYDSAKQTLENGASAQYYAQKFLNAFSTDLLGSLTIAKQAVYSTKYAAASANKLALGFYLECLAQQTDNPTYKFSMSELDNLSGILAGNVESFKTKYADGDTIVVSKDEFDSFVNTLYRNASDKSAFKEEYKKATAYLDDTVAYDKQYLDIAQSTAQTVTNTIKSYMSAAQSMLDNFNLNLDDLIADCTPKDVDYTSVQSVQNAISILSDKMAEAKSAINATAEDEAQIKALLEQSDAIAALDQARTDLSDALDQAKAAARDIFVAEKTARIA